MSRTLLLLHGYQQNVDIFKTETTPVEKVIYETFTTQTRIIYIEAPFHAGETMSGIATRSWWDPSALENVDRIDDTLRHMAKILEQYGPFDGIVGFSQGGALAAIMAGLLERSVKNRPFSFNTTHPRVAFVVSYSGYREHHNVLQNFYEHKIQTPILHFINPDDPIVSEDRCIRLTERCADIDGRVVSYTSPFHRVPTSKQTRLALKRFLSEFC